MRRRTAPRRAGVTLAVALLVGGCASSPEPVWVKPGTAGTDFQRDDAECRREAPGPGAGGVPALGIGGRRPALSQEDVYWTCMKGRGWTRRP